MPDSIQFLIIYFANLVLDYPLQCEFQKKYKQEYHYVMWVHCCIWGIGLSLVLLWLGVFAWWKLIFLVVGHFIMDTWKARGWYKNDTFVRYFNCRLKDHAAFFIDQTFHILQLLIVLFV